MTRNIEALIQNIYSNTARPVEGPWQCGEGGATWRVSRVGSRYAISVYHDGDLIDTAYGDILEILNRTIAMDANRRALLRRRRAR